MCMQLDINSPSIIVVQLPFSDVVEEKTKQTTGDTHALHKLIPQQLKVMQADV